MKRNQERPPIEAGLRHVHKLRPLSCSSPIHTVSPTPSFLKSSCDNGNELSSRSTFVGKQSWVNGIIRCASSNKPIRLDCRRRFRQPSTSDSRLVMTISVDEPATPLRLGSDLVTTSELSWPNANLILSFYCEPLHGREMRSP